MARMAPQGLSASSLKDAAPLPLPQNSPYMHSSSLMNDSRISLLSMIAPLEEQTRDRDEPSFKGSAESTRLSLGSAVKGTKSSRTLSGEHSTSPETGRPRSRTQSSEVSASALK
ncbi:hypothetical protein EV174_002970 [Coemansia sp. RSA 2320]|nr:hypothetical protein EV174_002970 [Coemansia sp. RSA 2320]